MKFADFPDFRQPDRLRDYPATAAANPVEHGLAQLQDDQQHAQRATGPGAQGATGSTGAQGSGGSVGFTGAQGATGSQGGAGAQGAAAEVKGDKGPTGGMSDEQKQLFKDMLDILVKKGIISSEEQIELQSHLY